MYPVSRSSSTRWPTDRFGGGSSRKEYFILNGFRNRPQWPRNSPESPLSLTYARAISSPEGVSSSQTVFDVPNFTLVHDMEQRWDGPLYARTYARFTSAVRNEGGSLALNLLQYEKSVALIATGGERFLTFLAGLSRGKKGVLRWLSQNRNITYASLQRKIRQRRKRVNSPYRLRSEKRQLRLLEELRFLEIVSGFILEFFYGWTPLVGDVRAAARTLTSEPKNSVLVRRTGRSKRTKERAWNGNSGEKYSWTESVTIRATAHVSNPNIALGNRLGALEVAYAAWDTIPWSFVIDWFVDVGSFLSNLTASAGYSFSNASVTRTREGYTEKTSYYWAYAGSNKFKVGTVAAQAKRKHREVGTPPLPLTIPWGSGLSIERGRNAYALIMQKLMPSLKKAVHN